MSITVTEQSIKKVNLGKQEICIANKIRKKKEKISLT